MEQLFYVTIEENGETQYLGYSGVFTPNKDHARQMTKPVAEDKQHNYKSIGEHNRNKAHYQYAKIEPVEEVVQVAQVVGEFL